jgi:hypothetical protein
LGEAVGADGAVGPRALPVARPAVIVVELGGTQLQDRFGSVGQPEFLAGFHAAVELLDRRLDRSAAVLCDAQKLGLVKRSFSGRLSFR